MVRDESGYTLIEVIIAMFILAIGVLAYVEGFGTAEVDGVRAHERIVAQEIGRMQISRWRSIPFDQAVLGVSSLDTHEANSDWSNPATLGGYCPLSSACATNTKMAFDTSQTWIKANVYTGGALCSDPRKSKTDVPSQQSSTVSTTCLSAPVGVSDTRLADGILVYSYVWYPTAGNNSIKDVAVVVRYADPAPGLSTSGTSNTALLTAGVQQSSLTFTATLTDSSGAGES